MRRALIAMILVSLVAVVAWAAPAGAAPTIASRPASQGVLLSGGSTVQFQVRAVCPEGYQVLESFAYITQTGLQNVESDFGFFTPTCNGRWQSFTVTVTSLDEQRFQPGAARANTYFLVEDPDTSETLTTSESRRIRLTA